MISAEMLVNLRFKFLNLGPTLITENFSDLI